MVVKQYIVNTRVIRLTEDDIVCYDDGEVIF